METMEFHPYKPTNMSCAIQASDEFYKVMSQRRTVREFDSRPINRKLLENVVRIAGSAPSGANRQPWHFAVIQDPKLKSELRQAAEEVELQFYSSEATKKWREDLKPFGTNHMKPYLTEAPAIIAVFSRTQISSPKGHEASQRTYYPVESTGIAVGFLISALHQLGISTLTHTPKPANFLNRLLGLDQTFRPFLLLAVGYAKKGTHVPLIRRKSLRDIAVFHPD